MKRRGNLKSEKGSSDPTNTKRVADGENVTMSPQEAAMNGKCFDIMQSSRVSNLTFDFLPVAMLKRGKAKAVTSKSEQYKFVIYGFLGICVASVLYVILFPKQKLGELAIIDDSTILVHNGQGHQFQHGRNELFANKTFGDVRGMFFSGLSDSNNVRHCKSAKAQSEEEVVNEE